MSKKSADASSSNGSNLAVGDVVEIHGLLGAKELNGRRGRIVAYVEETQRFGVKLEGSNEDSKAVKPANLRRLDGFLLRGSRFDARQSLVHRTLPPQLPERPQPCRQQWQKVQFKDENEYPDPARAYQSMKVVLVSLLCGIVVSQVELCQATWFVWSFLLMHVAGVMVLTDYAREGGLLVLCGTFGLHSGVALSEFLLWIFDRDGADSLGPWSLFMFFASLLYLHSFWTECLILPPDYITSVSLFFPMFPAFNAAVVVSCLELFLEWRWFPGYKFFGPVIFLGTVLMATGQALIWSACRVAHRNFWASCRNVEDEDRQDEMAVSLEIPNRRIVQDGPYRWERHPAYLGAMLWGIGAEVALCNPIMLLIVGFVLWASLLYVTLEEEQELYDEFKGGYANYSALTRCWIPLFNSFLSNAAFQREMSEHCEEGDDSDDFEEEDEEEECDDADVQSDDELLPAWDGVPKGGVLWNLRFREPIVLG